MADGNPNGIENAPSTDGDGDAQEPGPGENPGTDNQGTEGDNTERKQVTPEQTLGATRKQTDSGIAEIANLHEADFESAYSNRIAMIEQMINIIMLFNTTVQLQKNQEVDLKNVEEIQENALAFVDKYGPYLRKAKASLALGEETKILRQDILIIPDDTGEHSKDYDTNTVIKVCGKVNPSNAEDQMRNYFRKLFEHGKNLRFSHADYMQCLNSCLEGELYSELTIMLKKKKTFPEIVKFFDDIYYKPQTFEDYEEKLANFTRKPGEKIDIFMKRFLLQAEHADSLLPPHQQHFTTEVHKLALLEKVLLEPAKSEYIRSTREKERNHTYLNYDIQLAEAVHHEAYNDSVPVVEQPVSQYLHFLYSHRKQGNHSANAITRSQNQGKPLESLPTGGKKKPKKSVFDKNRDIDPYKSTTDMSRFYNAGEPKGPASAPPVAKPKKNGKGKKKQNQQSGSGQGSPFYRTKGNGQGKNRGKGNKKSQQANPQFTGSFNAPQGKKKSGKYNSRPVHVQDDRRTRVKYCVRCGTKRGKPNDHTPTDHMAINCPHYHKYCDENCSYCYDNKQLLAFHKDEDCIRKPH